MPRKQSFELPAIHNGDLTYQLSLLPFSIFYYPYITKVANQLTNDVLNWIGLFPKHLELLHHQLQYQAV